MKRSVLSLALVNFLALGISVSAAPVDVESTTYVNETTNAVYNVDQNGQVTTLTGAEAQEARALLDEGLATGKDMTVQETALRIIKNCRTVRGPRGGVRRVCVTHRVRI